MEVILDLINKAFGSTALDEVANILDEILINPSVSDVNSGVDIDATSTSGNENIDLTDAQKDISDLFMANVSDTTSSITSAIDYIRSLNKEERQIVRDKINNNTLIFKCR